MAYIRCIEEAEASPRLRDLYDRYRDSNGHIGGVLRVLGLNPRSIEGHYRLHGAVMSGRKGLSQVQREMIAVVVSAINECHY